MFGFTRLNPVSSAPYRPRNRANFDAQLAQARNLRANNAAEAKQLLAVAIEYLNQVGRFVSNQSLADVFVKTKEVTKGLTPPNIGEAVTSQNDNGLADTVSAVKTNVTVSNPVPGDEENVYTDEDKSERVAELKTAIRVGKLKKQDTSKAEAELQKIKGKKGSKPHLV